MEEYIRFLEKIAGNGHVALNATEYDGWILRFSGGYTCRANSVSVLRPSRKGIEEKVAYCEARYAEQGLPAIFKVTEPDAELAGYLLKRGYSVVTPTDVMVLDLEKAELSADMNGCVFDAEPWEWLPAYYEFENRKDPAVQAIYNGILSRVTVDTCYCTVMKDGKPAACASTAAEQGYALLQNVVVDPAMRGQGIGEKLCRAILAKEKERGTRYAYLQVVQANTAAVKLYEKLGFSRVYTYRYMKQAK